MQNMCRTENMKQELREAAAFLQVVCISGL